MTAYRTVTVNGLDIFYREAGSPDAPTILLLHGYPTSSHMFRNLIPALADRFHLVAPDYPGFGYSSMPTVDEFDYTFDRLAEVMTEFIAALKLKRYSLYLMDYGAPIGYRIATQQPERVDALIVQNGNAYEEGLGDFWQPIKAYWQQKTPENADRLRQSLTLASTKWQYTTGVKNLAAISPDTWNLDQSQLDRPGNQEIQLALLYSYHSNPPLYPQWQAYLRQYQPPTLVVWGKNDPCFRIDGAHAYKRDLQNLEFHLLDTGHFALEEEGDAIANYMIQFLAPRLQHIPALSTMSASWRMAPIPPFLLKTDDNPEGVDSARRRLRQRSVFDGIEQAIVADRPSYLSAFLAQFYNVDVLGGDRITDDAIRLSWQVAAGASAKATLDCVSSWLTDFRNDLPLIDVPTLIVQGDADRILPHESTGARLPKLIKNSQLVVIPGGPHAINWTHAEQINSALLDFLK